MPEFNLKCRACPRLARHLDQVRRDYPNYHARPVAPFGPVCSRLLIVGLAPGMHGANATGRPFTGDFAGIMLYKTLHAYGFASAPVASAADDGLILNNCRITNAVKCLPPENKPIAAEVNMCNQYLQAELAAMPKDGVILALGIIAHKSVVKALGLRQAEHAFAHGRHHVLSGKPQLLDSYHCSRYNTQTGRLTAQMFRDVFTKVKKILSQ